LRSHPSGTSLPARGPKGMSVRWSQEVRYCDSASWRLPGASRPGFRCHRERPTAGCASDPIGTGMCGAVPVASAARKGPSL
jgi:hypothetical protein